MNYNPEKHHRHLIRLNGYNYTREGAYYFTICCHQRRCLLGEIKDGVMHLNLVGATVKAVWESLPRHFPLIELDAFVVMPNHVHGIIVITDNRITLILTVTITITLTVGAKHSCLDVTIHHPNLHPRMLRPFQDVTTHYQLAVHNPVQ